MSITLNGTTGIITPGLSGDFIGTDVQSYSDVLTSYSSNGGLGFKNKIIGGDFSTNPWSRGTGFINPSSNTYLADNLFYSNGSDSAVSIYKTADAPTVSEAGIFTQHCFHLDVTTADTSIGASQYVYISNLIDGNSIISLGFGQSGTRYITLSFWVKSEKTGIFCVSFRNSSLTRSYVSEYTINSSNTWEKKIITIPVDIETWNYNSARISVIFSLLVGSTYQTGSADTWLNGNYISTTNQVNCLDSITNNFKLALIQLEAGSVATPFEIRNQDIERLLCGIPNDNTSTGASKNTYLQADGCFSFRNKIIGGDFTTNPWQRGTTLSLALNTGGYLADRFNVSNSTDGGAITVSKLAESPTAAEAGVFTQHCLYIDVTTADTSVTSGQYVYILQVVEGYNIANIGFGQAGTRYITLSFWVKSFKTGIYCVSFRNYNATRSYVAEYTINSSNTWEKKIITIPVDSSGTWYYDSGNGLSVTFTLACGTAYQAAASNTWYGANYISTANQVNGMDSISNDFKLALVQLEAGTQATPFETRLYQTELALCQRYYERCNNATGVYPDDSVTSMRSYNCHTTSYASVSININFNTIKRAIPTTYLRYSTNGGAKAESVAHSASVGGFYFGLGISGASYLDAHDWYANAEF